MLDARMPRLAVALARRWPRVRIAAHNVAQARPL